MQKIGHLKGDLDHQKQTCFWFGYDDIFFCKVIEENSKNGELPLPSSRNCAP